MHEDRPAAPWYWPAAQTKQSLELVLAFKLL
jgi:hypothetical protein